MIARLIATVIHELITEYRKLDGAVACERPHADEPPEQLPPVTSAYTERAGAWDHDQRHPPVANRVGFGGHP